MKYFDTYYAGINNDQAPHNSSKLPTAFITPDGNDKAAASRKETVDNWTFGWGGQRKTNTTKVVDNKPMRGFKIVDWNSRYSTDNKVVRVVDPRGYELEVYIPNLITLILECDIHQGKIDAELVWLRDGAMNRLYRVDSKEAKVAMKNFKKGPNQKPVQPKHEYGNLVSSTRGTDYVYLGLRNTQLVGLSGKVVVDQERYDAEMKWRRPYYINLSPADFNTVDADDVFYDNTERYHVYYNEHSDDFMFYTKQMVANVKGDAPEELLQKAESYENKPIITNKDTYFHPEKEKFAKTPYRDDGVYCNEARLGYFYTSIGRFTFREDFTSDLSFDDVFEYWDGHSMRFKQQKIIA